VAYFTSKLAAVVSFAMAEPGRLMMGQSASDAHVDDIDADGDYEMDDEYEQAQTPTFTPSMPKAQTSMPRVKRSTTRTRTKLSPWVPSR
jgi:hypothetical protein